MYRKTDVYSTAEDRRWSTPPPCRAYYSLSVTGPRFPGQSSVFVRRNSTSRRCKNTVYEDMSSRLSYIQVLAALDVHTARWIVEKCLKGELLHGRTVILVVRSSCPTRSLWSS